MDSCASCGVSFGDSVVPVRYFDPLNGGYIDICEACSGQISKEGRGRWQVCDIVYVKRLGEFYEYKARICGRG